MPCQAFRPPHSLCHCWRSTVMDNRFSWGSRTKQSVKLFAERLQLRSVQCHPFRSDPLGRFQWISEKTSTSADELPSLCTGGPWTWHPRSAPWHILSICTDGAKSHQMSMAQAVPSMLPVASKSVPFGGALLNLMLCLRLAAGRSAV